MHGERAQSQFLKRVGDHRAVHPAADPDHAIVGLPGTVRPDLHYELVERNSGLFRWKQLACSALFISSAVVAYPLCVKDEFRVACVHNAPTADAITLILGRDRLHNGIQTAWNACSSSTGVGTLMSTARCGP